MNEQKRVDVDWSKTGFYETENVLDVGVVPDYLELGPVKQEDVDAIREELDRSQKGSWISLIPAHKQQESPVNETKWEDTCKENPYVSEKVKGALVFYVYGMHLSMHDRI